MNHKPMTDDELNKWLKEWDKFKFSEPLQKYTTIPSIEVKQPVIHPAANAIQRLVTGSRNASAYLLDQAADLARFMVAHQEYVIVGDAEGIDQRIIAVCNQLKYTGIEVHGAKGFIKCKTLHGSNYTHDCSYPARDGIMVGRADYCDAFWDGKSPGTRLTMGMCKTMGIPIVLHQEDQKAPSMF